MEDRASGSWPTISASSGTPSGDGFTWESTDLDETAAKGRHAWEVAAAKLASGDYDLLILDELTYAVTLRLGSGRRRRDGHPEPVAPRPTSSSPGATPPPS